LTPLCASLPIRYDSQYAPDDRLAGGIHGEDRRGSPTFFGFVTMAIGCVRVEPHKEPALYSSEEIASVVALAKRRTKQQTSGFALADAREAETLLRGRAGIST